MRGFLLGGLLVLGLGACGKTDSDPGSAATGATGGTSAGAAGETWVSGGTGGVAQGGSGAVSGSGGSTGSGGAAGGGGFAGGVAGAGAVGGAGGECAGLDYCACRDRADCEVQSTACFCPCGIEPCEPDCVCGCGGGAYLGCAPTSLTSPGTIEGIWLIGWAGGLNHYSWVRISSGGVAEFLDGADLLGNAPIWCSGTGSWMLTAKPETVGFYLPSACTGFDTFTFESFGPAPTWVKGSILSASLGTAMPGQYYEAYKFSSSQCDAAMTSCTDPWL